MLVSRISRLYKTFYRAEYLETLNHKIKEVELDKIFEHYESTKHAFPASVLTFEQHVTHWKRFGYKVI